MKKRYIFLIVLALIVVLLGIFAYVNRANIAAVIQGFTTTTEELEQQRENAEKEAIETVKQHGVENIRPLTEEEAKQLSSGELTEEEAIKLVLGQTDEKPSETVTPPQNEEKPAKPVEEIPPEEKKKQEELKKANERIAQLVGKMYVLKSQFTGEIVNVKEWVKAEYLKLTPEERKSDSIKMKIGKVALAEVATLEKSCDAQVEAILSEMTTLLKQTGQSTDLVKQIRSAYEKEKQTTKSYYISKI